MKIEKGKTISKNNRIAILLYSTFIRVSVVFDHTILC